MKTIRIERHINCGETTCGPCHFLIDAYMLSLKRCKVFNNKVENDDQCKALRLKECIAAEVDDLK